MNQPVFAKPERAPVNLSQSQKQAPDPGQSKAEFKDEFEQHKQMRADTEVKLKTAAAKANTDVEKQIERVNAQLAGVDGGNKDTKELEELAKLTKADVDLAEQLIFKGFAMTEAAPENFPDHKFSICSTSADDISLIDEMVFEYVKSKEDEKTGAVDLPDANVRAFRNALTLALCVRGEGDKDMCEIAIQQLSTIKRAIGKCRELELDGDIDSLNKLRSELKKALKKRAAKITSMPTQIIDFLSQKKFEFDSKMYTIMTTKGILPKS